MPILSSVAEKVRRRIEQGTIVLPRNSWSVSHATFIWRMPESCFVMIELNFRMVSREAKISPLYKLLRICQNSAHKKWNNAVFVRKSAL
jgi:hypothetical protein